MAAVELALDAGLVVMRNGGSTVAADRSFNEALKGSSIEEAAAVWRLDLAAATYSAAGQSIALVRPVGPIGVHLKRASAVAVLTAQAAKGELAPDTLGAELQRIKHLPSPYGRWAIIGTAGATAGCFSQIPGGDWGSFGIAAVAAAVGQTLRGVLQGRKVAVAPVTLVCGLLSAVIASIGLRLGYSQVESATLIASVIYMVPGLPLINGFIDMISHRHLITGVERMVNASFLFLLLAIAIALAHVIVL